MNVQEIGCVLFMGVFLGGIIGWIVGSRIASDSPPLTNCMSFIEWLCAFVGALAGFYITLWMCYLLELLP